MNSRFWQLFPAKVVLGVVFGVTLVVVSMGEARADSGYVATGSCDLTPLLNLQIQKTEARIRENNPIAAKEIRQPQNNSLRLNVDKDGVVSGQGRVGPYGVDWWIIWEGKKSDFSTDVMDNDYQIALQGQQRGMVLSGVAVVREGSYGDYQTERLSWEAQQRGDQIVGEIKGLQDGRGLKFTLNKGEGEVSGLDEATMGELEEELEKSGVVITGDPEKREEWKTNLLGANNAYVIQDGKRVPLKDDMVLEPGMEIETEGEDGLAVFTTSTGEHIRLQGDGTRVTLMTTELVEDEQWKEVLDQYTEKRAEGSHSYERSDPNRPKRRTPVTVMQAGQMVVKYESGGKQGWWNAAFKSDHDEYDEGSSVGFARNVYSDRSGKERIAIEDSDPVELAFENHSVVEYLYEGDELKVKVYEGEAVAYRINLESKENEEIFRVGEGESVVIDVEKYGAGGESWEKGSFDVEEKSEAVEDLLRGSSWWGRLIMTIKGWFGKG